VMQGFKEALLAQEARQHKAAAATTATNTAQRWASEARHTTGTKGRAATPSKV